MKIRGRRRIQLLARAHTFDHRRPMHRIWALGKYPNIFFSFFKLYLNPPQKFAVGNIHKFLLVDVHGFVKVRGLLNFSSLLTSSHFISLFGRYMQCSPRSLSRLRRGWREKRQVHDILLQKWIFPLRGASGPCADGHAKNIYPFRKHPATRSAGERAPAMYRVLIKYQQRFRGGYRPCTKGWAAPARLSA